MSNDCSCGKCNCRYDYLCYYCKKEKEIDQLKQRILELENILKELIRLDDHRDEPYFEYEFYVNERGVLR